MDEIRKAGERAASLTRQLLAFSRRQVLEPKVLDLNGLIGNLEKMLRRLIGEDVELLTVLGPAIGRVQADAGQIEQVILNLAVNARDAMPKGGTLTIETQDVELDEAYAREHVTVRTGSYVMLAVTDTGAGMSAETQSHMFEPFFTTKAPGKGTGLGLATVYGIVKQSDGTVWVYSEVDKGTTFKIYLPRVDEIRAEEAHAESHIVPRGHETILVVEDEEIVRTLSTEILKNHGYRVLAAGNGEEGLRVCKEFYGAIDLLITDVVMPHMSGRELAEQVATIRPDTRVLYMSGFTDDAIVRHGVLDDGVFFIQKPFSPDALAIKARSVLDHFAKSANSLNLEPAVTDLGEVSHDNAPAN
ncbi:MAG TPA: hybrid sensor histidine kinase/response regulator [Blastocatellia bacterium]|nr:hybrid sensor histidine kinase/response regulator [Blastocatellia bacterium]